MLPGINYDNWPLIRRRLLLSIQIILHKDVLIVALCRVGLGVMPWNCVNCGLIIDRDHNAAVNILKLGSEGTLVEKEPLLVKYKQVTLLKHKASIL